MHVPVHLLNFLTDYKEIKIAINYGGFAGLYDNSILYTPEKMRQFEIKKHCINLRISVKTRLYIFFI